LYYLPCLVWYWEITCTEITISEDINILYYLPFLTILRLLNEFCHRVACEYIVKKIKLLKMWIYIYIYWYLNFSARFYSKIICLPWFKWNDPIIFQRKCLMTVVFKIIVLQSHVCQCFWWQVLSQSSLLRHIWPQ
jgi:hypothetical protein